MEHKAFHPRLKGVVLATAGALLISALSACGGDNSTTTTSSTNTSTSSSTPAASTLSGTVATGSALANANVAITDSAGNSPCQESTITTTALGSYTCTLKAGETAPFVIIVTDPSGNTAPLVSVATTTPAPGAALTVNATPLTTAIVSQLLGGADPTTIVGKPVDTAALQTITNNVVAQLAQVASSINLTNYNPFSTSFTAASSSSVGDTADMLLDIVKVTTNPTSGALQLTTIDGTSVPLASANDAGSALPTPPTNVSDLSKAAQALASQLTSCFALPASQRGTANTTIALADGGNRMDNMAAACANVFDSTYLHNGYSAGQKFFGMLANDQLTGVKFPVPEITSFYPASTNNPQDRAVLNIKYVDVNGYAANTFSQVRYDTSSSSWKHVGNQKVADVDAAPRIRKVQSVNPNKASEFRSGITFQINTHGPGSQFNGKQLKFAVVTGPGLPTNGIALVALPDNQSALSNVMDISNTQGDTSSIITAYANSLDPQRCGSGGNSSVTYNCPNFWFYRTQGITGSTLAANPTPAHSIQGNTVWAQPADGSDVTKVVKDAVYTFNLYYCLNTTCDSTPGQTVTKGILSDEVQATQAANLPWHSAGSQTLAALDPNGPLNGTLTSLTVDWVINTSAQPIKHVLVTTDPQGLTYTNAFPATKGASSVAVNLTNGESMPALTQGVSRGIMLRYLMTDNSAKDSVFSY
jgi:hypothetical protein